MYVKNTMLTALAAALMLSSVSGIALAQEPGRDGPKERCGPPHRAAMMMRGPAGMFIQALQQLDDDKDGKISKDEAKSGGDKIFAAIDADSDGSLTPGEMRQYREARMEAWKTAKQQPAIDEADADDDDATMDDDAGTPPPPPAPDDADQAQAPDVAPGPAGGPGRDGRDCGPREGKHHAKHEGMKRDGGKRDGDKRGGWRGDDRRGPHHRMEAQMGRMMGERMMRRIDTDENGQISKAEFDTAIEKMFTRFDKNEDGFISADDFPKGPSLLP